jgi:hypothetical protein
VPDLVEIFTLIPWNDQHNSGIDALHVVLPVLPQSERKQPKGGRSLTLDAFRWICSSRRIYRRRRSETRQRHGDCLVEGDSRVPASHYGSGAGAKRSCIATSPISSTLLNASPADGRNRVSGLVLVTPDVLVPRVRFHRVLKNAPKRLLFGQPYDCSHPSRHPPKAGCLNHAE